jgi:hypothetical protein
MNFNGLRRQKNVVSLAALAALSLGSVHIAVADSASVVAAKHNVIIFVVDGMRAGSINPIDSPTLYAIKTNGVSFANSHSIFPTFTTPNASAIATGHYLGDTGDFSNTVFSGYPMFNTGNFGKSPSTITPFLENNQILSDIDDHFASQNYLSEETLLAFARQNGYNTAAVGKVGPVGIQDVTQLNIDHGTNNFDIPTTVIIDDLTGVAGGVPLHPQIAAALNSSSVGVVATPRNQPAGTNTVPGTTSANLGQQQYFADSVTKAVLPTFAGNGKPFVLVYWSRDPDGTQHNQGDSLNSLTPGINGPTSRAAIKNADNNLKQILNYLAANGLASTTDVFVTADHGFNTISHHEVDAASDTTTSFSAGFTYRRTDASQEVNTGFTPVGFLAIDLANMLQLPMFDPDSQITVNSTKVYEPVDPSQTHTAVLEQHPASGDGLIGGTGAIQTPTDASVVVAANGGSDLIYLPTGTFTARAALVTQIVNFLATQDYTSGLFVDDQYGIVPGSLPLSDINLKGSAALPTPAIVINFRTFTVGGSASLQDSIVFADSALQEGQGMHGSFGRADTFNFMAAIGPDFKTQYVDNVPVSNADVQVTLASILGFNIPGVGTLMGRVATEALAGGVNLPATAITAGTVRSLPAPNGQRTLVRYQIVNGVRYFDSAGFPGRTVGL